MDRPRGTAPADGSGLEGWCRSQIAQPSSCAYRPFAASRKSVSGGISSLPHCSAMSPVWVPCPLKYDEEVIRQRLRIIDPPGFQWVTTRSVLGAAGD